MASQGRAQGWIVNAVAVPAAVCQPTTLRDPLPDAQAIDGERRRKKKDCPPQGAGLRLVASSKDASAPTKAVPRLERLIGPLVIDSHVIVLEPGLVVYKIYNG